VVLVDGKVGMGLAQDRGKSLSISGPLFIRNTSNGELVLDRVEAVGMRRGSLEILGAYVLLSGVNHTAAFGGYRVPATGRSLPGAVLRPHAEVQFVFGVKATKLGRHSFTSLDIIYHVGQTSYHATVPYEISICAPLTVKDCPSPLTPSS
jgi:hypothetical protein